MNTTSNGRSTHLADDELLRLIDGEEDAQRGAWETHLAACADCAGAAEALRRDARVLHEWLDVAAFEERGSIAPAASAEVRRRPAVAAPPGRLHGRARSWHARTWLRAAAVLALLATPVAAIPALREKLVDAITRREEPAAAAAPGSAEPRAASAAAIRFVPAPGAFLVEVAAVQAAGELRISRSAGAEAVFETSGESAGVPVVSAAVLRIGNTAQTRASYSFQVPAAVSSVTVRVGPNRVVIERDRIDAGAAVRLH